MKDKLKYILDQFLCLFNLGNLSPDITYGMVPKGLIHIHQGETRCFETNHRAEITAEQIIWKTWLGVKIPFFFDSIDQKLFIEKDGQWIIQFDIIASAFFLLSGWQEYFSENNDQYGRFRYSESVQHRFNFTHLPVVNYYFDILRTVLEKAYGKPIALAWQDPRIPFTVCLTHDIDTCETAWVEGSFSAVKKMDLVTPVKLIMKKLSGQDAWFNFSEILSLEKSHNATSTFFFIPTNKKKGKIKNGDYDLKKDKFKAVFRMIADFGGEVGLHGSIGSSTNSVILKKEFSFFPEPIRSNRFHFLLHDPKVTLKIMEESGVRIDSSLGFAEHFGFRNSFCFPFKPYDITESHAVNFYEIPLILMDGTLQKYMSLTPDQSFNEILNLIDEIKKFKGVFTVLWHNTHFSPYKYAGWREVYVKLLTYVNREKASIQNCSQIINRIIHE